MTDPIDLPAIRDQARHAAHALHMLAQMAPALAWCLDVIEELCREVERGRIAEPAGRVVDTRDRTSGA